MVREGCGSRGHCGGCAVQAPGPPHQGARARSEGGAVPSTTTRVSPRARSAPRPRKHCKWERTGTSEEGPGRSTGGRSAAAARAAGRPARRAERAGAPSSPPAGRRPGRRHRRSVRGGPGGAAPQPAQRCVEVVAQHGAARRGRRRQCPHHQQRAAGQHLQPGSHQVPEPALHAVPDHGAADRPADHEAHLRRGLVIVAVSQVHHDRAPRRTPTPPHRCGEILAAGQSDRRGQHGRIRSEVVRPTTGCDPCGGALR